MFGIKNTMDSNEINNRLREQRAKLILTMDQLLEDDGETDLLYRLNCLNKALASYKILNALIPPDMSRATLNISPEIIEKIETEILHLR